MPRWDAKHDTSAGRPAHPQTPAHLNDSRCSRYVCSAKASAWRKAMGSAPVNVQPATDGGQGGATIRGHGLMVCLPSIENPHP